MARGGAERVVNILSAEFAGMGHETIISTEEVAAVEYELSPLVRRIHAGLEPEDAGRSRIAKIVLRYLRLRKVIRRERPDVVISFCNKANFRSSVACVGLGIPLIVSVRNDPAIDYAPYRISTWIMERTAAGCVFQTPDAKAFFGKRFQERSCIIMNPLSRKDPGEPFIYRSDLPEFETEKKILCVGRITPQKNIMMLLGAFSNVVRAVPEASLLIYGGVQDKAYYEKLGNKVTELGLAEKVRFMGLTADVPGELRKAYLYVLSSDYEGMPNALLEAMAEGLPCIATDCPCGGPRMLIRDGESGMLVPVSDENALTQAMLQVLKDPQFAQKLADNAGKIKQMTDPGQVAAQWMDFIEKCRH